MDNRSRENTPPRRDSERPPVRRRKKKKKNLLPALVIGVIGVVIIALIIMGIKSLFEGSSKSEVSSSLSSSILDATPVPSATPVPEPTATPVPKAAQEADITGKDVEQLDNMIVVGDSAYEYYKYNNDVASKYIAAMNTAGKSAKGIADVYAMIIPSSIDIMLPLSFLNNYADVTSDQGKASSYILGSLDDSIKKVSLYDALKAHCDQSLYFRTDNHLSGLGGYYVYEQWAYTKGVTPVALADCTEKKYDDFLGNLYTSTENSAISEPETVTVYEPKANLSIKNITSDGSLEDGTVFPDVTNYDTSYKYSAFLDGPHLYSVITNSDLSDNSACVLVVDSNGTPIAPFIACHYQNVYLVDYRSYTSSVADLAKEKGAKDIIYCTSITATLAQSLVDGLEAVN